MPKLFYTQSSINVGEPALTKEIADNIPSKSLKGKELMYAVAFRVLKSLQEHNIIGDVYYAKDDGERLVISAKTPIPYEIEPRDEELIQTAFGHSKHLS